MYCEKCWLSAGANPNRSAFGVEFLVNPNINCVRNIAHTNVSRFCFIVGQSRLGRFVEHMCKLISCIELAEHMRIPEEVM